MSGILGYDPIRLPALRSRLLEAIADLAAITSWDPAASSAVAAVGRARLLLECEHLPAVDAVLASDAMERDGFGVRLHVPSRSVRHGAWGDVSDRERRLIDIVRAIALAGAGPTGLESLGDDELVDLLLQKAVLVVDVRTPEDVAMVERLSVEVLRRIGGEDGVALLDRLAAELDHDAWSQLASTADVVVDRAAEHAVAGHPAVGDAHAPMEVFGVMLLRVARHDGTAIDELVAHAEAHHGVAYAVVADDELADDELLLRRLTGALLVDGVSERARTGVDPLGRALAADRALMAVTARPDSAAALLLDDAAGDVILRRGLPLDDDVVDHVVTVGLMRPWVQRQGEDKSVGAARYQAVRGIEIWRRIVRASADDELRPGALRGGARSLAAYLPALDPGLRADAVRGASSRDEQEVRATVGGVRIGVATYGDLAGLLGRMTQDEQAAPMLASTLSAYTGHAIDDAIDEALLVDGHPADRHEEIGLEASAATELGRLVFDGIDGEETRLRAQHIHDQEGRMMLASQAFATIGFLARNHPLYMATRPFHSTFQRAIDRALTPEPPTLSRELVLDQAHLFTVRFAEAMVGATPDVRQRLGLGSIDAAHWEALGDSVERYWQAPDDEARIVAFDELLALTFDDGLMTEASPDVSTYEDAYRRTAEAAGVERLR